MTYPRNLGQGMMALCLGQRRLDCPQTLKRQDNITLIKVGSKIGYNRPLFPDYLSVGRSD